MSASFEIRWAQHSDVSGIKALYDDIAEKYPDNLTPFSEEVTPKFVEYGLKNALERGYALVVEKNSKIIGYSKAYTSQCIRSAHILSDSTVIVASDHLNSIIGPRLISMIKKTIMPSMRHIMHLYSFPHANNERSIRLLEGLGGMVECGRREKAILCKNLTFIDEVTLRFDNKDFSQEALKAYHSYLIGKYSKEESSLNIPMSVNIPYAHAETIPNATFTSSAQNFFTLN